MQSAEKRSSTRARILVVDDEAVIRDLERHVLEELGHEVLEAASADEAMRLAREQKPDLILLDILMPGLDGIHLCKLLRADKATEDVRILIVSGLEPTRALEESIIAGADDFLSKPIDVTELVVRVRSLLRVRNIQDSERRTEAYIRSLQAYRQT